MVARVQSLHSRFNAVAPLTLLLAERHGVIKFEKPCSADYTIKIYPIISYLTIYTDSMNTALCR